MEAIVELINASEVFLKTEKEVACELVHYCIDPSNTDYYGFIAVMNEKVCGYICFGPTPMTAGTWDIYWIVVRKRDRRSSIGFKLIKETERFIKKRGGKRIIIDTSCQSSYIPARNLYEKCNYKPISVLPDYYRMGWHRVTYFKKL